MRSLIDESSMRGIPETLLFPLRQVLMKCDEFFNSRQIYAVFSSEKLKLWQYGLPIRDNMLDQVDITITYLADKYRTNGENALVIFLRTVGGRYHTDDERHDLLIRLADQLEWWMQCPPIEVLSTEANPEAAHMLLIDEAERMLKCARSVARVEVPCFLNGRHSGGTFGTSWLIAPGLALTCWHVIEARDALEPPIVTTDLQMQLENTLLTFDYTVAGKGLQYKVASLEYPTIETQTLDYAILRLTDREDLPLIDRGYLLLDIDAPLTAQTSLYIIQHPLGQPQQVAGNIFKRFSSSVGRILYKTPTEPGTSGAPVFNKINWRVVALHNGENKTECLREGTLLKNILSELKQNRPNLHNEIINAQNAKE